jgi:hypothetical protein
MDEQERREIHRRAREILARDPERREHRGWLESHRDSITGQIDLNDQAKMDRSKSEQTNNKPKLNGEQPGLVYKTFLTHAQPRTPAPMMDSETQAAWDRWLTAHLDRFMQETIVPVVGQALGMTEGELREEIETKFAALRTKHDGKIIRKVRHG